ncbi:response regulator [Xylanibacillus composti]|uniref:Response regulatory domain-containing protein n=1 Tax=Xylanibacillus composti TaxID=1572762 RepID=A0A8J4M4Z2_9BACL|nr:response regulator [Xylanibacillus composti]GIQ71436.1 hypothetical protein XYCOK13_42600 [Xylanibacillus composti]
MLRAIIVDDEKRSIKRLVHLLSDCNWLDVCRTFEHPQEAYAYVQENPVDVAFLDISMPDVNGMKLSSLLTACNDETNIVFVTGHDEYAVQAFNLNALDYLMKPVDEARMSQTLSKIKRIRRISDQAPDISVMLFNGFKVYSGGTLRTPLKLRSPKTEELFAFLICRGTVSREEVIDALWPKLEYDKALRNLNTNLYYIRKSLGESQSQSCLRVSRNEISIEKNGLSCDAYTFDSIVRRVRLAGLADLSLVDQAEALYTGPLLKGRDYSWLGETGHNYEQEFIGLLDAAARHCLSEGKAETALRYFDAIVALDALREDVYYEMIKLFVKLGRRIDADRYFQQLSSMLRRELGASPDSAIIKLVQEMR